jgi:hypothetical protein
MPDPAAELRQAVERLIEQKAHAIQTGQGIEPGSRVIAPTNPHAGGVDTGADQSFSTGYDSGTGLTVLAFTWDISNWDEDVWTEDA